MFGIGFLTGFLVGGFIGILLMCIVVSGRGGEE